MTWSLDITDNLTPRLEALRSFMSADNINKIIGQSAANTFRQHFLAREQTPNKNHWPKLHFYSAAANSTSFQVVSDGAVVSVQKLGIRQRLQGGEINAGVTSKWLTIPARQEAYGKRAREFNDLRAVIFIRGQLGALVQANRTDISIGKKGVKNRGESGGGVFFWLVKKVRQEPDSTVIPDAQTLGDNIRADLDVAIQRQTR